MKKGIVLSGILLSLMVVVLLVGAASAARWRLNLGVGYGTYSPSLGKINEFIRECNSWTENTFGLTNFEMEEMEETASVYSLNNRTEIGPFWEVGLDLNYWQAKEISLDKELTIPLEGGAEKTINVYGDFSARIAFADLIVYRKFSKSKLSPFVGVGIGYYGADIWGDYSAWGSTYIPPWDWEYRDVYEGFSVSDSSVGYVLTAGAVWTPIEHLRISLEAKYHWVPELKGEFAEEDVYNEGFSSLPMEPKPFKLDLSGLTTGITLMLRF